MMLRLFMSGLQTEDQPNKVQTDRAPSMDRNNVAAGEHASPRSASVGPLLKMANASA